MAIATDAENKQSFMQFKTVLKVEIVLFQIMYSTGPRRMKRRPTWASYHHALVQ